MKVTRSLVRLRGIDGIIAATSASSGEHLEAAFALGICIVLVDSEVAGIDVDMVTIDNRTTAERGVNHLLEQGHRRIAIITGPLIASFDRGTRKQAHRRPGASVLPQIWPRG